MKEGQEEESPLEQVKGFVHAVFQAMREKSEDAQKYFESVSKMAVDPQASPELQELGRVLQKYMSGIQNPDLSGLPQELAEIVQKELGEGGKDEG